MNAIVTAILGFVAQVLGSLIQRSKTGVDADADQGLLRRGGNRLRTWMQSSRAHPRGKPDSSGTVLQDPRVHPDQQ